MQPTEPLQQPQSTVNGQPANLRPNPVAERDLGDEQVGIAHRRILAELRQSVVDLGGGCSTIRPMDLGDEILARAREAAGRTHPVPAAEPELEGLRVEAMEQLALMPEPPAYRRAADPAREAAHARLPAAEALLERALLFQKASASTRFEPQARSIAQALEAQILALAAIAQGQILPGEERVEQARIKARAVGELAAAFHRVGAEQAPVYVRQTGVSRYDPHEAEHLEVTLPCPNPGCRKPALYALSTRSPTHRFVCTTCRQPFVGYFGEVRSVEATRNAKAAHYALHIEEVGGRDRRVEFDDASGGTLPVAPRDLVALLYGAGQTLVAVENLSSARVLWIRPKEACFLATAAYGSGAPELDTFRAFRDRALLTRPTGRLLVRAYYLAGPHLARPVAASPRLRRAARRVLEVLRADLSRRGFDR